MDLEEVLIEEVRNWPLLYDLGNVDYKNMRKKEYAWRKLATTVKLSETECKKRWKNLRDSFQRCKRADEVASGSGAPTQKRKWRYYEAMCFLKRVTNSRRTISNVTEYVNMSDYIIEELTDESELVEVVPSLDEASTSVDSSELPGTSVLTSTTYVKKNSEKFQKLLDLAASSITETCAAFVGQNEPQSSTALHFASLAVKLSEAGLPPSAINEIEAHVSEVVFSGIRKYSK